MKSIIIASLAICTPAYAWNGYDYNQNSHVEIEKGNLVRPGREIEYYDYSSGKYSYGDVESVNRYGSKVELEIRDNETGERRTFEMDKD